MKAEPPKAATTRATTPRPTPPRATITNATPKVAETPEALLRDALRYRADIEAKFYSFGLTLRALARRENYTYLGYASFEDLLEERQLTSRTTAFRLTSIVDAFEEPLARRLGSDKAYAVIRYTALKHPARTPTQVLAIDPQIRHDGQLVPLSVITASALNEAVSALQAAARRAPQVPVARFQKATRSLAQLLRHAGVTAERVQTKPRRGKQPIIRIDLLLEEAEDLIALVKSLR